MISKDPSFQPFFPVTEVKNSQKICLAQAEKAIRVSF